MLSAAARLVGHGVSTFSYVARDLVRRLVGQPGVRPTARAAPPPARCATKPEVPPVSHSSRPQRLLRLGSEAAAPTAELLPHPELGPGGLDSWSRMV